MCWPHSEEDLYKFYRFLCTFRLSIHFNLEREGDGRVPFFDVVIDHSCDVEKYFVVKF